MDEPTSALTDAEVETLFRLIEQLKAKGTGIVYISHRMDELRRLADRVTVLRDGAYIGSLEKAEIDISKVIEMMVGRHVDESTRPAVKDFSAEPVVLEVEGAQHEEPARRRLLRPAPGGRDPRLRRPDGGGGGAHRDGAGRDRSRPPGRRHDPHRGTPPVRIRQPEDAVKHGVGYLSEDRKLLGLMLDQDVTFNTVLASLSSYTNALGWMGDRKAKNQTKQYVQQLRVKTPPSTRSSSSSPEATSRRSSSPGG